jgi:hypothetical protein
MFKTSFLRAAGLEFIAGCWVGEDTEFLAKALSRCGSISFSTGSHYVYVQHSEMTMKTTRSTKEKTLARYACGTESICRAARYIAEHAKSRKVRDVARNYMLAEGLINTLNVAARRHDETEFRRVLHDTETKRALTASLRYVFRKPEVFFKAAILLIAPRTYFRMRSSVSIRMLG